MFFKYADRSATDHTVVTYGAIDSINNHIANGPVLEGHDENVGGWVFKMTEDVLEAIKRFERGATRSVYHWILSYRAGGIDIFMPVKKIGEDCRISIASVSKAITELEECGIIRCIDPNYVIGKRAKLFRVVDAESLRLMDSKDKSNVVIGSIDEDQFFDGNWFNALWQHTRFFQSGIDFMLFVHSLDGVYRPGKYRLAKARSAWRSHAKRNGLSMEVC